ncbi:MAG: hypothetical protein EBE86_018515 [Hormoscilla sp. GUM202]|nr:hypothetical protein [Hormoscilla sp. GUM202]
MSFLIQKGLFKTDFTDYHAVLGVPVDAEKKEIRKRYEDRQKTARQQRHPQ